MDTATSLDLSATSMRPREPSGTALRPFEPRTDVVGWGADLDRANRPAVPMERTPPRLPNPPQGDPSQQAPTVRILHSTERPGITPLFGTPNPPSGLSGFIREQAFKQSENDVRHWMMLFVADRINVLEGVAQDLGRGKVPGPWGHRPV